MIIYIYLLINYYEKFGTGQLSRSLFKYTWEFKYTYVYLYRGSVTQSGEGAEDMH
jgi:hypothetical protein